MDATNQEAQGAAALGAKLNSLGEIISALSGEEKNPPKELSIYILQYAITLVLLQHRAEVVEAGYQQVAGLTQSDIANRLDLHNASSMTLWNEELLEQALAELKAKPWIREESPSGENKSRWRII